MSAQKHNFIHYFVTVVYYTLRASVGAFFSIALALFGIYILINLPDLAKILIGLPLTLGAGGYAINKISTVLSLIFSPTYSRAICIICSPKNHGT